MAYRKIFPTCSLILFYKLKMKYNFSSELRNFTKKKQETHKFRQVRKHHHAHDSS